MANPIRSSFVGAIICLLLPACQAGLIPTPTVPASPTPAFSETTTPDAPTPTPYPPPVASPTLAAVSPPDSRRTHYQLLANLDFKSGQLQVDERIDYLNDTGTDLEGMILVLEPARFTERFHLNSSTWVADGTDVDIRTIEDGIVQLELPALLADGERIALELAFSLELPLDPGKLSFFNNQVHLGDWYAFVPAFRSPQGWLAYHPNPVGETLVYDLANFDVQLQVRNAPESIEIAASAPGTAKAGKYTYQAWGYRNFAMALSPDYVVQEMRAAEVQLFGYALPETEQAGEAALEAAASALQVYSDQFMPYPHPSFTLVAGNFPDGLEFDGLAFISQDYYGWYTGSLRDYLPLLAAHEVAHQWWLAGVGSDQAIEPWLDEALSIYSELLWLEQLGPENVDWWWEFRIQPFEPLAGYLDDPVYQYGSFRPYVNAIYLRGAGMLRDLRNVIGDEAFFDALREYAQSYWGSEATGEMFMEIMGKYSDENLETVWGQYFRP